MRDVDDTNLTEELKMWNQFLEYSEIEKGRHRINVFSTDTLDPQFVLEQ